MNNPFNQKNAIYLILTFCLLAGCGRVDKYVLLSPYEKGYQYQYKVNLHGHTTERDGNYAYSPKELLVKAKEYGFDAFAITDLPHAGGIVEDPEINGILHIPGIEYGGKPHLIGIGIDSITDSKDKQIQIDHIKNQGGLAYVPHPYWGGYDENLMDNYKGFDGVAVFNSLTYGVAVHEGRESEVIPYNENVIDAMLSKGRTIAIMAEEDTKYEGSHRYGHQLNTAWMKIWINVLPAQLEVKDILEAITTKAFTSHGRHLRTHPAPPVFEEISIDGLIVTVMLNKTCQIAFITAGGNIKKEINHTSGSYEVSPDDVYVRIRATFSGSHPSWAWTNPIYIDKR